MKQAVHALLRWWVDGLLLRTLPTAWRPAAAHAVLLVRMESDSLYCRHLDRRGTTLEERRIKEEEGTSNSHEFSKADLEWLRAKERSDACLTLLLTPEQGLRTTLRLPRAARVNLAQVIAFEMDRQTPFKTTDIYYDFRLAEEHAQYLEVELVLVPRHTMESLLEHARAWKLRVESVDMDNGQAWGMGFNLLPRRASEYRAASGSVFARLSLSKTLILLTLPLAAASLYAPLLHLAGHTEQLEQQVKELANKTTYIRKLEKRHNTLLRTKGFLERISASQPPGLDVLLQVTRLVPDGSWLERLELHHNTLRLQGLSPAASSLLQAFEAAPLFHDSHFLAPLTRSEQNLEHFSLGTKVLSPSAQVIGSALK